jgi:hypothetical protein
VTQLGRPNKERAQQRTSAKHYSGDEIKEDEVGEACSTHGTDEECIQYFGWKN